MVTIGMNYRILPGKETVFETAFERVLGAMEKLEGHDSSSLYRKVGSTDEGLEYLIVSNWTSEDAFQEFVASAQFKKVTDWGAENILAGRPQHTTYRAA